MKRRNLLMGAAAVPMSLALPESFARADTATRGKLTIWLGYPETADAFRLAQAEFAKTYPNVQVELLTFELREFEAKLAISVPTGSGPDILALHDFLFPRYHGSGSLDAVPADLAQVVNDARVIDAPFKDVVTRDGRPWGVPWWSGRNSLFCNLDHLREAGLSGPPTTYDEIWTHAQKLTKRAANGDLTRAGISLRKTGPSGVTQKFVYFYYQLAGVQISVQACRCWNRAAGPAPFGRRSARRSTLPVAFCSIMSNICTAPKSRTTGHCVPTHRASHRAIPRCSCAKAGSSPSSRRMAQRSISALRRSPGARRGVLST
jgi:hypothetical protein